MAAHPDHQGGRVGGSGEATELCKVIVDSTVQGKAVAHPADGTLLNRGREHMVKRAAAAGITLRQNYNRLAPQLVPLSARYAHAKQYRGCVAA